MEKQNKETEQPRVVAGEQFILRYGQVEVSATSSIHTAEELGNLVVRTYNYLEKKNKLHKKKNGYIN